MNKAIFIDRDSTVNEPYYNEALGALDSPMNPEQFKLLPRSAEAIKRINDSDYLAVLITNQPAIAKGYLTEETLDAIHKKMNDELAKSGAKFDAIYHCPHKEEDNCSCRKPNTGLFDLAAKELSTDLSKSYMIGDSWRDVNAGNSAGCTTILVGVIGKCDYCRLLEKKNSKPDFMVKDLYESVDLILKEG